MTHKPNILALNFTHQNKDEKNFADTVVLLGVLTGRELALGALSAETGPVRGTLFWNWGRLRLQGPWGGRRWLTKGRKSGKVLMPEAMLPSHRRGKWARKIGRFRSSLASRP